MDWCASMPGWGVHWFGGLLLLFGWILIIVGIAAIIRWFWSRFKRGSPTAPENPLEILRSRHAKGEIDKPEFEEKRKHILGS